jgi:hypothetical protein
MNLTISNLTSFVIDEKFYKKIGSSWTLDLLNMAIIPPIGFIGFILNIICFGVLFKIKVKTNNGNNIKLYQYLKIYTLISSLICLIMGFYWATYSPRFYKYSLSYLSKFYRCRVIGYGLLSLYFFNNTLDILIGLDRISIFLTLVKMDKFRKLNPYYLCSFLVLACFCISSSFIFTFEILDDQKYFTSPNVVTYCILNEFGKSRFGLIINMIVILIRDIVTLILEIITSILVVCLYLKYANIFDFARIFDLSMNVETHNQYISSSNNNISIQPRFNNIIFKNLTQRQNKGKQILLMSIVLLVSAVATHLLVGIVFTFLVNVYFENVYVYFTLVWFASFSVVFKNFANIFVFYFFNRNFKKQFNMCFNIDY